MRGSVLCGRPFWILGTVVWSVLIALDGCGGLVSAQPVTAVLRPLPSAPRIGIAWQPIGSLDDGAAVHITIEYTADVGWVGIGGSSTSGMDGPITVCQLREGRCLALLGARFSIHSQNSSDDSITVLQRTTDCDATSDESTRLCSLTFQRRLLTTSGVPAFHWGTAGRVIFATGDVGPAGAIIGHRGSDIGAAFIDFSLSTADQTAAPSSVPSARVALTAALWTCVLIVVIQIASFAKIRVHHRVRAAVGVTAVLAYLALWVAYIAVTVRRRPGSVDAWATALGDGCAVALGVMLITGSRRFFGQELLTVSHERMVLYHTATGTAFIGCLVAHMVRIVQVYQVTILVQWDQLVCGFISVLALVMFTTAMLRHRLSFSLFRTLHFSWIAIVLLSAWHAPSMVIYCCLPGLVLLSCTGLSMLLSIWGTRVESIHQFPRSGIVVIDMSRWHFAWLGGGRHPSMGIGPGQWCYVSCASWAARRVLGPLWHPFSVARADVRWPAGGGWPRQHLRFIIKPVRPVADAENEDSGESPVRVDAQGYQVLGVGKRSVPWTVALSRMASQHHTFTTHSADEIALQVLDDLDEGGAYDAEDIKSLHPLAAVSPNKEVRAPVLRPNPPIANNPLARLVACGPYGRVQVPLLQYETVVMASGGVGVTPNLLTLQYLARMMSDERQQGAYSVRRVVWIWTLRDFELFLHVCHEDLRSYTQMLRAAGVNVDLIVTVIASSADDSHGEYLRMMDADTEAMLPVTFAREAPAVDVQINRVFDTLTDAAAVTSCGPKRFMEGVRNAVNATRSSSVAIHLHEESFAL